MTLPLLAARLRRGSGAKEPSDQASASPCNHAAENSPTHRLSPKVAPAAEPREGVRQIEGASVAKALLAIFGWSAIALGFAVIALGSIVSEAADGRGAFWVFLTGSAPLLLSGALLIGFAQVIELLEQIARSATSAASANHPPPAGRGGWDQPAPKAAPVRATFE